MLAFLYFLSFGLSAQAGKLEIHDAGYYEILKKNSQYECRFIVDDSYGILFTRGDGDTIRVNMITAGVNEGEKSAFDLAIKKKAYLGYYLYAHIRDERFGRYVEVELRNQRMPRLHYNFSGMFMQTSAMYSKKQDGSEEEKLYPDGSHRMSCRNL